MEGRADRNGTGNGSLATSQPAAWQFNGTAQEEEMERYEANIQTFYADKVWSRIDITTCVGGSSITVTTTSAYRTRDKLTCPPLNNHEALTDEIHSKCERISLQRTKAKK